MHSETYTIFDERLIKKILDTHGDTLRQLRQIEEGLNETFYDMKKPIRALILAVLTGESLLLVGPPGTAKSSLIRQFCKTIGIDGSNEDDHSYFEYLLTQFTEPSELLGYYDLSKVQQQGELRRKRDGMIQDARVVYLDEVFNASSAILNTLLAMVNERFYHERGEVVWTELDVLFGATNQLPDTDDLLALFDRFFLRCHIDSVNADKIAIQQMIEAAWVATYKVDREVNRQERIPKQKVSKPIVANPHANLLDSLRNFRRDIDGMSGNLLPKTTGSPESINFYSRLAGYIGNMRRFSLSRMSNRRLLKVAYLLMVNMLYRRAFAPDKHLSQQLIEEDFGLLRFVSDVPNIPEIYEDKLPKLKIEL